MNRCALISVLLLLSQAQTHAATPTLTSLFPAGGARGQTVEVTASGSFDRWPLGAWVDEAGVTIESTPTKGKLLIRIAPDARPGTRLIRLYSSEGATEVRPFVVGTIPEILEVEPNDEPAKVQAVVSPTVVNGRLGKRGDVDVFAVTLSKGQTLVAALDGNRRLGSPMDAVLQLASPLGFVLEQVDDAPGLDPKLVFKAPDNGTYHVRVFAFPSVQNSTIGFAGGDAFIYRLTLNTGPSLERTMPMAIGPEGLGIVDAIGRDIPSESRRIRVESTARGDRARAWHPRLAGDVELPRLTYPSLVEAPGSSRDKPQPLAVPSAISGRVSASGEEDVYQFHARASQTLRIRVEAQSVGSPLDPIVRVLDASGKVVAEQDDIRSEAWDVDLSFKVPADGAYRLVVRDLNRAGGLEFVYLLHVADPAEMMLTATLAQDRFNVEAGKSVELSIGQQRPRGRGRGRQPAQEEPDRPIAFEVLGLPAGVTAESKEAKGATRTITLKATPEALAFSGPIVVIGRADGREWIIPATVEGLNTTIESPWLTIIRR